MSIRVIEKTHAYSWDAIFEVLQAAHNDLLHNGVKMEITTLSPERLEKRLEGKGKCYVALDGDKIVGTGAYRMKELSKWYLPDGKQMELTMMAVLPEYQGRHIFSMLYQVLEDEARKLGVSVLEIDTPNENKKAQQVYLSKGFAYVDFFSAHQAHYSVVMVKWLDGSLFPGIYCKLRYTLKKIYICIRYKPGKTKRF